MDTAEMFFVKLLELQPERSAEISVMIAKASYDAKKYNKAEFWYLEKAKHAPLTVGELVYLGLSQKALNKLPDADSTFAKILSISPKYEFGWLTRAQINELMDTAQEKKLYLAKPYYEKYIELASTSADPSKFRDRMIYAYLYLAVYSVQNDNNEMAKSYCNLVLNLEPENETAKDYLKILSGEKVRKK
jgi:tetratricopeptide (TPR) repeat protein